ncbi:flagellar hook-length control protein FliK [Thermodesulfatator atlanticus]
MKIEASMSNNSLGAFNTNNSNSFNAGLDFFALLLGLLGKGEAIFTEIKGNISEEISNKNLADLENQLADIPFLKDFLEKFQKLSEGSKGEETSDLSNLSDLIAFLKNHTQKLHLTNKGTNENINKDEEIVIINSYFNNFTNGKLPQENKTQENYLNNDIVKILEKSNNTTPSKILKKIISKKEAYISKENELKIQKTIQNKKTQETNNKVELTKKDISSEYLLNKNYQNISKTPQDNPQKIKDNYFNPKDKEIQPPNSTNKALTQNEKFLKIEKNIEKQDKIDKIEIRKDPVNNNNTDKITTKELNKNIKDINQKADEHIKNTLEIKSQLKFQPEHKVKEIDHKHQNTEINFVRHNLQNQKIQNQEHQTYLQKNTEIRPQEIPHFVKELIIKTNNEGKHHIKIKLDPPNLGEVKISMSIDKGEVKLIFTVENSQAAQALQQQINNLNKAILDCGLQLNSCHINLGQNQDEQKRNFQGNQDKKKVAKIGNDLNEESKVPDYYQGIINIKI